MKTKFQKWLMAFLMACAVIGCFSIRGLAASYSAAVTLNGDWASLEMPKDDDVLQFDFTVPAAGKLEISFQTFRAYTTFKLYNDDFSTQYFSLSNNSGSELTPQTQTKTIWLQAGVYHIQAKDSWLNGFGGTGASRVKIVYTNAGTTEQEPNNSFTLAMSLAKDSLIRGALLKIDDRYDFYKFQVTSASRDTQITFTSWVSAYVLEIYNDQFIRVDKTRVSGSETTPGVSTRTLKLSPGTYYIKISDDYVGEDHSFGVYTLQWGDAPCEHKWDDGKVTVEPTVFVTGVRKYTCTICSETKSEDIAKLTPQVKLSKTKLTLKKGKKYTLKVKTRSTGDYIKSWKTSNKKIATVSKSGVVTAKKKGKVTITVTMKSGVKATCKVTVK